jgi:hypothetical protein
LPEQEFEMTVFANLTLAIAKDLRAHIEPFSDFGPIISLE